VVTSAPAIAAETLPLHSFNQSPLVQIHGLPAIGTARVLNEHNGDFSLDLQIASNFTFATSSSEQLMLDGETHRLTLAARLGLANGYECGFELPYLAHSGGSLDKSIERWHSTFGLPEGGRPDSPRNQINYHYRRNGIDLVHVTQSTSGAGDARITGAMQLSNASAGRDVALRGSLKLPTGDSAELRGSGSTDLALWLSVAPQSRAGGSWYGYGGGGILYMSKSDVLPEQQRSFVAFGSIGIGLPLVPSLTAVAQLDAHSPFYDGSQFRQLSAYAMQGLLGLSWEFMPKKHLVASFSEDLVVNTSPDVVFNLSLTLPF
jgi:hypothetical protein